MLQQLKSKSIAIYTYIINLYETFFKIIFPKELNLQI